MMILWANFKRVFIKPINIMMMIVVPIVLNLIVISLVSKPDQYTVLLICQEDTELTDEIKQCFEDEFVVEYTDDIESAKQSVLDGYADYLIVFPDGLTERVLTGDFKVQTYSRHDDYSLKPARVFIESYFSALQQMGVAANGDETVFYNGLDEYNSKNYTSEYKYCGRISTVSIDNSISSLGYVAVGMVYFITFATMLLFEDKKCGVFVRLASSPISRFSYFFQHLISYLIFAIIQILIMILMVPHLVDVQYGDSFAQSFRLFLVCTVFAATCISIGIAVSSFSKNTVMANSLISMINVPMLMLGGCFWPRSIMPQSVQMVGNIMPTTWFLKSATYILQEEPLSEYIGWVALLVGLTLVLLTVSFITTTTGMLNPDKGGRIDNDGNA